MRLVLPLGLLLILTTTGALSQGGGPATVRVDAAARMPMATTILVPGTVVSRNDAAVAAEADGRLIEVADIGAHAGAGDIIARIENVQLRLRKAEQEAVVKREEARLQYLTREQARLAALAERNVAAKNQLDQIESERDVARGDLEVARSRLDQINDQVYRLEMRAPFEGVVVERLTQPGERVTIGTPVVRMVDPDHLEVISRAPLEYYRFLHIGDTVGMTAAGEPVEGVVRTLVAVGDENTHLFEVRIDLVGQPMPVGQTVRVTLPASEEKEVLSVPRDALVLRPDGISVFVIDEEEKARRVAVSTGLASGDRIEVKGPINPGDRVVVRGNERLRDGQQVAIQGAPPATASADN